MLNIIELQEDITRQLISVYKGSWGKDQERYKDGYVEGLQYVRNWIRAEIEKDEKREKEKRQAREEQRRHVEKIWMTISIIINTLLILYVLKAGG